jgi:diaminopimelate decarboxylase
VINFQELADKYKTPLYVYDFDYMNTQYTALKESFKGRKSLLAYAVKANSNLSVVQNFARMGSGADCVSIGEVRRALLAGIPPYRILFSGVGKQDDEIQEAIEHDILYINAESMAELERIDLIAKKIDKVCRISVRVNPNIDPKTHPYISTGLSANKFGVDIDTAKRMYIFAKSSSHLDPVGIHFHIGSQLTELDPIRESAEIVADLVRSLHVIDVDLKFFDIGGGIGIQYSDETTITPYDYAQAILSTMTGLDMTIVCEPGRYLTANAGYFLTRVLYEKKNKEKRFVIVDGAMNDLIRPSLYNAYHKIDTIVKNEEITKADVVGPVCESGDFLAKDYELPALTHNDLLIVHSAGSYGFGMGSNYNTRGRSAEIAVENGIDRIIRKRESFEDIIALEKDYLQEVK